MRSLSKRLSFLFVAMILVGTIIVAIFSYVLYYNETVNLSAERALIGAKTVAAGIDGDGLEKAMTDQKKDEQWDRVKAFVDKAAVDNDLKYLYVYDAVNYGDTFSYYVEGWNPATGDDPLDFLYKEDASINSEEIYVTIDTGVATQSKAYSDDIFGKLVTGYAPIINSKGKVVAVVGADIAIEVILADIHKFGIELIIIVVGFCILFAFISVTYINRKIGKPIIGLTVAAEKLSSGNLNITDKYYSNDEIGRLSVAFSQMIDSTKSQIDILNQLADGDLSMEITPRSDEDEMSIAIERTIAKLTDMMISFQESSDHFAVTSVQIADEAKNLADSTTRQLSAIQTLAGSVAMITEKTKNNAETAENATLLFGGISDSAKSGTEQMENMVEAVGEINQACTAINDVAKTIDDIAFQTNILSLNAAIEAARAGQSGKGFAVVADEVRNLASKSAGSAKETADLITNSLDKSVLGVQIAKDTYNQLLSIMESMSESVGHIKSISASSVEQSAEISAINASLDQVTEMVNQTAKSARESAEAGDALSMQAEQLNKLLLTFKHN
jgi:methyl-accepting chemotaxis protein